MNNKKESGQASRLLLVLAAVVLVAVIITFLIMRMVEKPPPPPPGPDVTLPVYEQKLGNIRFIFESGLDRGKILRASEIINKDAYYQQKEMTTGERFVQVTIGAQNKGTENTIEDAWDIENIVDSEGRNFIPLDSYEIEAWLPNPNSCGAVLKPEFDPTPCTKIYEVSKASTGLKIRVLSGKNGKTITDAEKADQFLLDLIVK